MDVIRSFVENRVRFLVIGGRAVKFHGYPRPSKDLDLLVELSPENWTRLNPALRPLNAAVKPFEELSPDRKYQAKLNFYPTVEFVTRINGVAFEEAWSDSVETTFDGLSFRVLSKAHVILSKRGSTRQVDMDDINALEAIP